MSSPQTRQLQVGDIRLSVREWGSESAPLLMLLHGLASTSHMFDLIAPSLAEHFHVVAPDQRGHGLSEKPSHGYDFETIARDLDKLLDTFAADQVFLVGHSWGAYTALYYAATRASRVAKVGLIDGGLRSFAEIYPAWHDAEAQMSPPTYQHRTVREITAMIEVDWLGAAFRPELLPLALSVFDTSDPHEVHAHLSHTNHMQIVRALWEMRPPEFFADVQCPLLIVCAIASGEQADDQIQAVVARAEQVIGDVQVVWMQDTIHDVPWQRPQQLAAILQQFLGGSSKQD